MGRIITNKHINGRDPNVQDFYDGISVENPEERRRIAMGRIILTLNSGSEAIWILNENNVPRLVAQPIDVEIPPEIREYISLSISNTIETVESYADNVVNNAMDEFLGLVISSGDTMYNELKGYVDALSARTDSVTSEISARIDELSAYTMNLKLSDHFMLTSDEYRMLSVLGELDGENVSNETYDLNGIERGSVIYYSDEIYYCIYDENGSTPESGGTIIISGNTIEITYDISGTTVILDDYVTIEDEHTLVFNEGGGDSGSGTEVIGNTIDFGGIGIEDEHTIVLGNNYDIEDNNTLIII